MLSRTRLRRLAIASLQDETAPFGESCDDIGPIWENCNGAMIDLYDSPAGWLGDVINTEGYNPATFPAIAVYADNERWQFQGQGETQLTGSISLIFDIYVCSDSEWSAEDMLDDLHERVLYRMFRLSEVGGLRPLMTKNPESITVRNERTRGGDRILYVRQLEISVPVTECISVPDCGTDDPVCFDPVQTPATCGP